MKRILKRGLGIWPGIIAVMCITVLTTSVYAYLFTTCEYGTGWWGEGDDTCYHDTIHGGCISGNCRSWFSNGGCVFPGTYCNSVDAADMRAWDNGSWECASVGYIAYYCGSFSAPGQTYSCECQPTSL